MILEQMREFYRARAQTRLPTGNPSGSRFGSCTAQLQFLLSKAVQPADWQLRALMLFEGGEMVEEWWATQIRRAFRPPHAWGLRQEPFYFPVELERHDSERLEAMIEHRERWGRLVPDFRRPEVRVRERIAPDGTMTRRPFFQHLLPRDPVDHLRAENWGFVLDAPARIVYAPVYIDFLLFHADLARLAVLEAKAVSNWVFRRALVGLMGYRERCQLVGEAYSVGTDVTWLLYRKETAHLLELSYTKGSDRVRVEIQRTNGQREAFIGGVASKSASKLLTLDGQEVPVPDDRTWEVASVWTPWDDHRLVEDIQERIRLALLASVDEAENFKREWGPDFTCHDCEGTGIVVCRFCGGTRASLISKPPGKLCGACVHSVGLPSTRPCEPCKGKGSFDETDLPSFPCGYAIAPDTPVLRDDYEWVPAKSLAVGDRLIGVEEYAVRPSRARRIAIGTVAHVIPRRARTVRIETDLGVVVCSPEHPWLVRLPSRSGGNHWREARHIKPGALLAYLTSPVATDIHHEDYMGGYIRGLIDGDGAVQSRRERTPTVRVAMSDQEPLERLTWYLQYFGLMTHMEPFSAYSKKPMWSVRFGGRHHDRHEVVRSLLTWPLYTRESAAGYLGGMFDAEGHLSHGSNGNLRIYQVMGGGVDASIRQAVETLGLPMRPERWRSRRGVGAYRIYGQGQASKWARFLAAVRPAIPAKRSLEGQLLRSSWAQTHTVSFGEELDLVDLTVAGTRTFVAGGFVSHNCPVSHGCYGSIYRLDLTAQRPRYIVTREDWERSGLSFTKPRFA